MNVESVTIENGVQAMQGGFEWEHDHRATPWGRVPGYALSATTGLRPERDYRAKPWGQVRLIARTACPQTMRCRLSPCPATSLSKRATCGSERRAWRCIATQSAPKRHRHVNKCLRLPTVGLAEMANPVFGALCPTAGKAAPNWHWGESRQDRKNPWKTSLNVLWHTSCKYQAEA